MRRMNKGKIPENPIIAEKMTGRKVRFDTWRDFSGVRIWTDGSTFNNGKKDPNKPSLGGMGFVGEINGEEQFSSNSGHEDVTINQMELGAIIAALEYCVIANIKHVMIITDSEYCSKGVNEYLANWMKRGWKTSGGAPVKNQDLWKKYLTFVNKVKHQIFWERGHSDMPFNDRADEMATDATRAMKLDYFQRTGIRLD